MTNSIYNDILNAKATNKKLLAVLLDPDKLSSNQLPDLISKIHETLITHIFVGGSIVADHKTDVIIKHLKTLTEIPILIFPGDSNQISKYADGILFLSLLSGNNPDYLITQHIKSAPILKELNIEIIPTGYILIDGGNETAVQKVSKTKPIPANNTELITNTALAGEYLGKKLIYLEAGSGAKTPVDPKHIKSVASALSIPIIVGGGIKSKTQLDDAYNAGADLVVIGTAFENNLDFFQIIFKNCNK